jgi:ATP-dependent Clp protease ATP-binding subunit ClpX
MGCFVAEPSTVTEKRSPPLICSFCGKNEDEVGAIVGGVNCFICDECVEVCAQEINRIKVSRPRVTVEN